MAFFLAIAVNFDPYAYFFRNRSEIFSQRIDLSLGDDGRKKLSEVYRAFTSCLQTRSMYKTIYTLCNSFSNGQKYSLRSSGISRTSIIGLFSSPKSY